MKRKTDFTEKGTLIIEFKNITPTTNRKCNLTTRKIDSYKNVNGLERAKEIVINRNKHNVKSAVFSQYSGTEFKIR